MRLQQMKTRRPRVTILMAVLNEAPALPAVLRALRRLRPACPVVAVDDGSTDGSGRLLREAAGRNLMVLRHPRNLGKGAAIRTALVHVRTPYALIHDADLETDPADIPRLLQAGARNPGGAVFGNRFPPGGGRYAVPPLTRLANALLTGMTNALFGTRLHDMACAWKLFPAGALRHPPLRARGFDIDAEITGRLLGSGIPVVEVPVRDRPRTYGEGKKIHPVDGIKILLRLAATRLGRPPAIPRAVQGKIGTGRE